MIVVKDFLLKDYLKIWWIFLFDNEPNRIDTQALYTFPVSLKDSVYNFRIAIVDEKFLYHNYESNT